MVEVLVLGTADWDQAIATNQHYAVRELAREHRVTFVQSMGLRTPELKMRDIARIFRRLTGRFQRNAGGARRELPSGVRVVSPRVLPRHRGLARRANRVLLRRQFKSWTSEVQPKVLWLYSPLDYGLAAHADLIVYHCVDLLGTVPGIDNDMIDAAERSLAATGGVVAAGSSPAVVEHLRAAGFADPLFWPNVADTGVFSKLAIDSVSGRSGAVFAGNMTTTKVDFALLASLLDEGVELHLAGPIAEGGGDARRQVEELVTAGAKYHGLLTLEELARLQATCLVGLIPYVANEYTAGVSPLKTYEYLASGLAVVSTGVPSVEAVDGHVVTATSDSFVAAALETLTIAPSPSIGGERTAIAAAHSWVGRGAQARAVIHKELNIEAARDA